MVGPTLQVAIRRCIDAQAFYRLCVLVHSDIARLDSASTALQQHYNWPRLELGLLVSRGVRDLPPDQRGRAAEQLVRETIVQHAPGPLLCTRIDVLFEPSLALDPLRLFRECSRSVTLVVFWPGSTSQGRLTYATAAPPHAHYRIWDHLEISAGCVLDL